MKQLTLEFKHWLAIMVLLLSGTTSAGAFELTINEVTQSTQNDGRLPVYGIFAGSYQKCEYVTPAELLTGMTGKTINQVTYYIAHYSQLVYMGNCKVFLKEVDFTEYKTKTYSGLKDATVVYEGPLNATGQKMIIPFTTPYEYKGGNLLIGIYIDNLVGPDGQTTAEGASVRFYGLRNEVTNGITGYNKNSYSFPEDYITLIGFLPKTTFDCDNQPHSITYNNHGSKVSMTFTGCEADNTATVGTPITATATVAPGYALSNVRAESDVTVTDNGSLTYTFTMPDHSVYVNSDLLRDISYKVDVTDPLPLAEGEPLRFADGSTISFVLKDVIDGKPGTAMTKNTNYSVSFDKTLNGVGKYKATFTGIPEGGYTNSFTVDFNIQKMYETDEILANYYGTQYYAEDLETFDDPNHEMLATVTKVEGSNVKIEALKESKVKGGYPFLIYNTTGAPKKFKLWATIDPITTSTNPTPAAEYTGTAANKTFTASDMTSGKDFFVLQNGTEFVYVLNAGTIKAHRCWIEVANGSSARLLTITADATGISDVKAAAEADGMFDLQGRRLTGKPSQRGMYVIDGKKVIVK